MTDPLPDELPRDETTSEARPHDEPLKGESALADSPAQESSDDFMDELEPDEDVDEFADELAAPARSAGELHEMPDPTAAPAAGFYDAGPDLHALDDLTLIGRPGVLDRLGPAHFRSRGFSFMGFLQTVYDHVATQVTEVKAGAVLFNSPPTSAETPLNSDIPPSFS